MTDQTMTDQTMTPSVGSYSNLAQCFPQVLKWCAIEIACYFAANGAMRLCGFKGGLRLQRLAGYLGLYPIFVLMVYYAHVGAWDVYPLGSSGRATFSSPNGELFNHLYLSSNIVAALGQAQTERGALLWQLMAHHALSLVCFGAGFYFDR